MQRNGLVDWIVSWQGLLLIHDNVVSRGRSGLCTWALLAMERIRARVNFIPRRPLSAAAIKRLPLAYWPLSKGPMDKLDELFDLQAALNKRIGVDTAAMSEAEKTQWVLNYTRAMQQEIAELVDSVPWRGRPNTKPLMNRMPKWRWSIFSTRFTRQVLGMTPEDVYAAYTKKNKVNHQRQDGYVEKDAADSRHI